MERAQSDEYIGTGHSEPGEDGGVRKSPMAFESWEALEAYAKTRPSCTIVPDRVREIADAQEPPMPPWLPTFMLGMFIGAALFALGMCALVWAK